MIDLQLWMAPFVVVFVGHAFAVGFYAGTYYVKRVADPDADSRRPQWLQDAIDAYRNSPRRPLGPDELDDVDWDR